ncbi:MAG TPA: GWxTD domain-containing protein [Ignavibacteriaceae bacterium]|nr:GWxTD domain-containing protein [Ignavibacteriaceae bacterium]
MKKLLLTFVFLLLSFQVFPQKKFVFEFDYAQFGYDTLSNYMEVYYSFNQNGLKQEGNKIEPILQVIIQDTSKGEPLVDKEWKINHEIKDTSDMSRSLIGTLSFHLPAGLYKVTIGGKDGFNDKSKKYISEYVKVDPMVKSTTSISNIQLASSIIQESTNKGSIFYKNSYEIVPIPTSVFGDNLPVVFYYLELYGLQQIKPENNIKLNTYVFNSKGKMVVNKTKVITHNTNTRVEVGSVPINKLYTDTYTLIISLIDSADNYGVTSSKKFFVYNPDVVNTDTSSGEVSSSLSSEFGVMSEEELDEMFEKSRYIATESEEDKYEAINNVEGKREFMFNFWKSRDKDPSTPQNEYFREYLNKIELSNQRYGTIQKEGWRSDRGRVFLIYGEPSEVERYPNQLDTKPYEIWHYNELEGGVIFVFADLSGFNDYLLLHSTLRGEMRDDDWMRRIESF